MIRFRAYGLHISLRKREKLRLYNNYELKKDAHERTLQNEHLLEMVKQLELLVSQLIVFTCNIYHCLVANFVLVLTRIPGKISWVLISWAFALKEKYYQLETVFFT